MPETHDMDETRPVRTADPERQPEVPTDDSDRSVADYEASDQRPGPDHPGKVEKPTDLKRPSVLLAVRRSVREFLDDDCTDLAAALTYYSVLAIFPAASPCCRCSGSSGRAQNAVRRDARRPAAAGRPGHTPEHRGAPRGAGRQPGRGPRAGRSVSPVALWSASGYVGAFSRAMNRSTRSRRAGRSGRSARCSSSSPWSPSCSAPLALVILIVSGPVAESIGKRIGVGDDAAPGLEHREVAGARRSW